jgi:hypothetical protein
VSEEIIGNGDPLSAQVLNGTIKVDGVPVDDRGGDEAQAGRTEALVLEGAVSDLALTMKEDRATERIAGLALVESSMAALPPPLPLRNSDRCIRRPSYEAQRAFHGRGPLPCGPRPRRVLSLESNGELPFVRTVGGEC